MPGPDDSMPASATLTVSRDRLGLNVGANGMPASATLTVSRDRVEKIEMCLLALTGYVRGMLNADAADAGAIPGPNPSTRDRSCSRSPHRRGGLVAQSSDPSLSTSAAAGRPSSASLAATSPTPTSSASLPAARPTSSASLARVDDPGPVPCFYVLRLELVPWKHVRTDWQDANEDDRRHRLPKISGLLPRVHQLVARQRFSRLHLW